MTPGNLNTHDLKVTLSTILITTASHIHLDSYSYMLKFLLGLSIF